MEEEVQWGGVSGQRRNRSIEAARHMATIVREREWKPESNSSTMTYGDERMVGNLWRRAKCIRVSFA